MTPTKHTTRCHVTHRGHVKNRGIPLYPMVTLKRSTLYGELRFQTAV